MLVATGRLMSLRCRQELKAKPLMLVQAGRLIAVRLLEWWKASCATSVTNCAMIEKGAPFAWALAFSASAFLSRPLTAMVMGIDSTFS